MRTKTKLVGVCVALALAIPGCQRSMAPAPGVRIEQSMIPVGSLASQLGMTVDETTDTFVVLRGGGNTVLVFTHSEGRFFVNGKAIGSVGQVARTGGEVQVPRALVGRIRPHLGAEPIPTPVSPPRATGSVVIDPGHGGRDPGTTSVTGVHEKHVNLQIAGKVTAALRSKGVDVTMTRRGDHYIELEDRAAIANRRQADLFVSIHGDSAPDPGARGFTLYIAHAASPDSYAAARAIGQAMAATGLKNRGVRRADYRVLVQTRGPAVLIETGYLSNRQDAARLQDARFQSRLATAIADGIVRHLR
jgi:N-acetylmuramoyl-L-alanine amidase